MIKNLRFSALATAIAVGTITVGTMTLGAAAHAADAKKPATDMSQLRELIQQQREALNKQEKALLAQRIRLEALEAQVHQATEARVQPAVHVPTPNVPRNRDSDQYRHYTQGDTTEGTTSIDAPKDSKAEARPEVAAIADVGGVLLPKGRLVIEPAFN
ncbi:MAG: hypothetical protein HQ511_11145 [Rhodospirillales bacterium]|nr:hypothetical protein [Rhodospirillales bacterium]